MVGDAQVINIAPSEAMEWFMFIIGGISVAGVALIGFIWRYINQEVKSVKGNVSDVHERIECMKNECEECKNNIISRLQRNEIAAQKFVNRDEIGTLIDTLKRGFDTSMSQINVRFDNLSNQTTARLDQIVSLILQQKNSSHG